MSRSTSVSLLSRKPPFQPKWGGFGSLEHREGEGAEPLGPTVPYSTALSCGICHTPVPGGHTVRGDAGQGEALKAARPQKADSSQPVGSTAQAAIFPSDSSILGTAPAKAGSSDPKDTVLVQEKVPGCVGEAIALPKGRCGGHMSAWNSTVMMPRHQPILPHSQPGLIMPQGWSRPCEGGTASPEGLSLCLGRKLSLCLSTRPQDKQLAEEMSALLRPNCPRQDSPGGARHTSGSSTAHNIRDSPAQLLQVF